MSNPYQSPGGVPRRDMRPSPVWYQVFYQIHLPVWYFGLALIGASWLKVVSPTVGWYGFGIAMAVWGAAKLLPPLAGVRHRELLILDSHSLRTRNEIFHHAIDRFRAGEWLMYDGVSFVYWNETQLACSLPYPTPQLDENVARELVDHVLAVFQEIKAAAPEFASAVAGRELYISVAYSQGGATKELCRKIGDEFEFLGES